MQTRPLILSAIAGGLAMGVIFSQTVPNTLRAASEPAWRALIQPQYRVAYTAVRAPAYGHGPEDATISAMPLPDDEAAYTLPPEYAAAERFARTEAKAAAEAERRYRLAYAKAMRPVPEAQAAEEPQAPALADTESAAPAGEPSAKVVTVAALSAD